MNGFAIPYVIEEPTDSDGKLWLSCIRVAQAFLVALSFTIIHHISNPMDMSANGLTVLTATLIATETAFLVIMFSLFCFRNRKQSKTEKVSPPYGAEKVPPTYYI